MRNENRRWKPDGSRDYLAEWRELHWIGKALFLGIGFFWLSFVIVEIMPLLWR